MAEAEKNAERTARIKLPEIAGIAVAQSRKVADAVVFTAIQTIRLFLAGSPKKDPKRHPFGFCQVGSSSKHDYPSSYNKVIAHLGDLGYISCVNGK